MISLGSPWTWTGGQTGQSAAVLVVLLLVVETVDAVLSWLDDTTGWACKALVLAAGAVLMLG